MSLCIGTKKELICVFETFFYYKNARILAVFFTVPLMSHFYFLYHIQRFYVQHFFITYNAFSIYIYIYTVKVKQYLCQKKLWACWQKILFC